MKQTIHAENPLLQPSPYRNDVPSYDRVKTEHFMPALEAAIAEAKAEIEEIKSVKNPNFENIIEALEKSGRTLDTVAGVFFHFDGVNNTDELQTISLDFQTKLSQHGSDVALDEKLFAQVKAVYDNKAKEKLTLEQDLLLDDTYKSFVRNGANLQGEKREQLRKLDEKLAEIKNKYSQNILQETNSFELYIDNEAELEGLPEGAKVAAHEAAKENGKDDKWLFTLHAPSLIPVLSYSSNRNLREKMWRAFSSRCKTGIYDNQANVLEIVNLRNTRAKLLGYETHADYVFEERMAKKKETVLQMLEDYSGSVKKFALKEHDELVNFIKKSGGPADVKPWDISYYSEKMKEEIYGFDGEELRPYFQFEKVRAGAFEVASRLYDIRFEKANDYPLYHADVETFDVFDNKTNELVGVFYTDYFPRKTKQGGAWMNDYVKQDRTAEGKRKPPVIGNHGNFTKPTKTKPSLLTLNEVLTLFHEFGHGLHGLLSDTNYRAHAGTNVKWDFVELPSQIMENWVKEKEVLNIFAKHYETGESMPDELIDKTRAAENFRSASGFLRQVQLAKLDMMWHMANPEDIENVEAFEYEVCKDYYILPPEGGLVSPSFSHIFDGGYAAGYYSYKWAEILDADAFEAFKEKGLFHAETAKKFRAMLSKGGSVDPEELYFEFRGKKADPNALLRRKGLLKLMAVLDIIFAPNPIFRKKCERVVMVDQEIQKLADDMLETMEAQKAVGLGANMVGSTKPVAVVDLQENGISKPYVFVNPEIIWSSDETQSFEEASLSFPGISANITRPKAIKVKYLDYNGNQQELEAEGFFATVIQHEVDYLNGKTFIDHLSKLKRDVITKKLQKFAKFYTPHVHDEHCNH